MEHQTQYFTVSNNKVHFKLSISFNDEFKSNQDPIIIWYSDPQLYKELEIWDRYNFNLKLYYHLKEKFKNSNVIKAFEKFCRINNINVKDAKKELLEAFKILVKLKLIPEQHNVQKIVESFKTINKEGFTDDEIKKLFETYNDELNVDAFNNALRGVTCMMKNGKTIIYHCDIELALSCGFENREPRSFEWD